MTAEEVTCKKMNRVWGRIVESLNMGVTSEAIYAEMRRFEELLDSLTEESADAKTTYEEKIKTAWSRAATIEKDKATALAKPSIIVENKADPSELPRDPLPKWNGKVETFFSFWSLFTKRVLDQTNLTDESKRSRLCNAVPEEVQAMIVGLDLAKAKDWLVDKYQSKWAVKEYVAKHLNTINVRNKSDIAGLRQLTDCLQKTSKVVDAVPGNALELKIDVFNMTYSKVPASIRDKYYETGQDKDLSLLSQLLEKQLRIAQADQASLVVGTQLPITTSATTCNYCKLPGHIVSGCPAKKDKKCYDCGQMGHIAKFCKIASNNKEITNYSWRSSPGQVGAITANKDDPRPRCTTEYSGKRCKGIVDPGSMVTVFPNDVVKEDGPVQSYTMADGASQLYVKGPIETKFNLDGKPFEFPVYTQCAEEAIIGADFLKSARAKIDMADGTVTFPGKVTAASEITETPTEADQMRVYEEVIRAEAKELRGSVDRCDLVKRTPEEKVFEEVIKTEYKDLMEGIGRCDLVKVDIDTGDHKPIAIRNRRIPLAYMDELAKHVASLLEEDIIENSVSEWCFPLVAVRKKDGSIRMANDLRKLNELIKRDAFPMPRIDEILEGIGANARLFSRLDLRKGYYQVMLSDDAKQKTAFSFQGKLYQFKRVPFGLSTAPQEFQRVMERILGDLPFVRIYLDDIVVFSVTEEEHNEHVRQVLDRIRAANLRLNKEKCEFGREEIEFLGFKLEAGKKSPNDEKTKIIANFPVPQSNRQLRGFLGLVNYLRHLIPDFADLAGPLFKASNMKKLSWSDECNTSFNLLKEKLSSKPIVFFPDWNLPFKESK